MSPGPGHPKDAGILLDLFATLPADVPVLGVCLGHQALVLACGGPLEVDPVPVHGMASLVHHEQARLFEGLPNPFTAGRYHSLRAVRDHLPDALELVGWTDDGVVMAVQHRELPRYGLQFHPESILTPHGGVIVENVLREAAAWRGSS
jgi:anthranilate synthase/aminodeoxychorismate synthase-like glutamine amidotransferase